MSEGRDDDGDGFSDTARVGRNNDRRKGYITLLRRNAAGEESRLGINYENEIVVQMEATGDFANLRLPRRGDPMP
ncbi:MAG: hypothetical protein P3X24_001360, partial [bacterium]|nr:hypothetical protein [bacterium]